MRKSLLHRCDSIQGTDYIANPFFLNLKVSRTTTENLRWQFGGYIIRVTFIKSVTSLVQKIVTKLIGSQYLVAQFLWIHFFLSCWTSDVTNSPKVMKLMSLPKCHFRFLIVVLETLKFEWQCSQYLELNPTCGKCQHVVLHYQIFLQFARPIFGTRKPIR